MSTRPERLLTQHSKHYKDGFRLYEDIRNRNDLPEEVLQKIWLPTGYLTFTTMKEYVEPKADELVAAGAESGEYQELILGMMKYATMSGTLARWRLTKGIYTFHDELRGALLDTSPPKNIPTHLFHRLPEWAVYIDIEGEENEDQIVGCFASLDWEPDGGWNLELVFVDETNDGFPISLSLEKESVGDMIADYVMTAGAQKVGVDDDLKGYMKRAATRFIPFILYLCSEEPDVVNKKHPEYKPGNPYPKRTKGKIRWFGPDGARRWDVGLTVGKQLEQANTTFKGTGAKKSPHIRRAHWHGYWSGPRDGDRQFKMKWLPPTVIAARE